MEKARYSKKKIIKIKYGLIQILVIWSRRMIQESYNSYLKHYNRSQLFYALKGIAWIVFSERNTFEAVEAIELTHPRFLLKIAQYDGDNKEADKNEKAYFCHVLKQTITVQCITNTTH
jgi:hypothetical protein